MSESQVLYAHVYHLVSLIQRLLICKHGCQREAVTDILNFLYIRSLFQQQQQHHQQQQQQQQQQHKK